MCFSQKGLINKVINQDLIMSLSLKVVFIPIFPVASDAQKDTVDFCRIS